MKTISQIQQEVLATAQVTLDELQASIEKFWEQGWERNEEAKRTCQASKWYADNISRAIRTYASHKNLYEKILSGEQAQKLANEIKDMAGTDRWNNNSYFDIAFNALGQFISKVQATDGFAAKIAETVDKTMNPYGKKVAFISDKQSWILAVAAVENNITL